MAWTIVFRKRFDHDLDRLRDLRGTAFDLEGLKYALTLLADDTPLPSQFRDHALADDWAHRREFHLAGDDLVIYLRKPRLREIVLLRAGTHRQLFRRRLPRRNRNQ
ncbi:MAG: type II toxin-antitoxin system YafQ family toxin [Nevskiaceae bacterium]|nr:type II toxin-antitoxin system YafQ family toxin [Nevskiaceae bacterium]